MIFAIFLNPSVGVNHGDNHGTIISNEDGWLYKDRSYMSYLKLEFKFQISNYYSHSLIWTFQIEGESGHVVRDKNLDIQTCQYN